MSVQTLHMHVRMDSPLMAIAEVNRLKYIRAVVSRCRRKIVYRHQWQLAVFFSSEFHLSSKIATLDIWRNIAMDVVESCYRIFSSPLCKRIFPFPYKLFVALYKSIVSISVRTRVGCDCTFVLRDTSDNVERVFSA